jgi:hypothetical protein
VFVRDPQLAKIKQDTTKFVAERLGKHKYSTRNEVSGPDGEPQQIKVTIEDYGNKDNSTA